MIPYKNDRLDTYTGKKPKNSAQKQGIRSESCQPFTRNRNVVTSEGMILKSNAVFPVAAVTSKGCHRKTQGCVVTQQGLLNKYTEVCHLKQQGWSSEFYGKREDMSREFRQLTARNRGVLTSEGSGRNLLIISLG